MTRRGGVVAEQFQDLLARITPTDAELDKAEERFGEIRIRLERSFHGKPARLVGSLRKDTFVRGHSDIDILAPRYSEWVMRAESAAVEPADRY